MLAQGEFASFLTGDKEKRETILERLTNTKHFTDYGNAIANLHKQSKGHMLNCKEACKLEEGHILKEEDLALLLQEKQEKEKQKNELNESIIALGQQITQLNLIETNQKAIGDAQARLTRLEDVTALQSTFATLAADLADRECQLGALKEAVKEDEQWLEVRKEQEELYTKSGEYLIQLEQLKEKSEKIKRLEQQKKAAEGQVEALQTALKTANEQVEQAQQAVASKQKAIGEKAQERTTLLPEEINQKL
jgi:DNA repair exonuclease SbcCD ATPase subunit